MKNPNIIFLHIPKTAGTTFLDILKRNYRADEIFQVDGLKPEISFKSLFNSDQKERDKIKAICGHMTLNIHMSFKQKFRYLTFLRNPVEQYISNYYYIKRIKVHNFYEEVNAMKSIGEFIDFSYRMNWNNIQTRHLSGIAKNMTYSNIDFNKDGCKYLNIAKDNLNSLLDYVFITEEFDDALILIKHIIGWKHISYKKHNVTINRPKIENHSEATIEAIKELQKFDIELYNMAKEKYHNLKMEHNLNWEKEHFYLKTRLLFFNQYLNTHDFIINSRTKLRIRSRIQELFKKES
jgi:hypothetical protein